VPDKETALDSYPNKIYTCVVADKKNPLHKQLELERFLHVVTYVENSAQSIKKLTTSELQRLNHHLSGYSDDEAWRFGAAQVEIPGGHIRQMNLISNPIVRAREIISESELLAANDRPVEAATHLYANLVLEHLFKEANRRTAVLAAYWLLVEHRVEIDVKEFLQLPIGNLQNKGEFEDLGRKIKALTKS
jgi:hypothetical protein